MNVYLVSFADMSMGVTAYRFKQEAESCGAFKSVFMYNENSLPADFMERFGKLCYMPIETYQNFAKMSKTNPSKDTCFVGKDGSVIADLDPRSVYNKSTIKKVPIFGFGFMCWKPYVILHTMNQLKKGDILLYLDSGTHISQNQDKLKDKILELAKNLEHYPVTTVFDGWKLEKICKKELFQFLGMDYESNKNKNTVASFLVMTRVCEESKRFMKEWLSVFEKCPQYIEDCSYIGGKIYEQTKQSRKYERSLHDQSILSCLVAKYNIKTVEIEDHLSEGKNHKVVKGLYDKCFIPLSDKHFFPLEIPEILAIHDFLNSGIDIYNDFLRYKVTNGSQFLKINYPYEFEKLSEHYGKGLMAGCNDVPEKTKAYELLNSVKTNILNYFSFKDKREGVNLHLVDYTDLYDINYVIENAFWEEYEGDIQKIYDNEGEIYYDMPERIDLYSVVAEIKNNIVGVCLAGYGDDPNTVEIDRIAVLPEYRGKGISIMMMDRVIESIFKRLSNISKIVIHHKDINFRAISMSRKFGFYEKGYVEDYYSEGVRALELELDRDTFNKIRNLRK